MGDLNRDPIQIQLFEAMRLYLELNDWTEDDFLAQIELILDGAGPPDKGTRIAHAATLTAVRPHTVNPIEFKQLARDLAAHYGHY